MRHTQACVSFKRRLRKIRESHTSRKDTRLVALDTRVRPLESAKVNTGVCEISRSTGSGQRQPVAGVIVLVTEAKRRRYYGHCWLKQAEGSFAII